MRFAEYKLGILKRKVCMNKANRCIICGGKTHTIEYEKFGWPFDVCKGCGFIKKLVAVTDADERTTYGQHNNSIDSPDYVAYLKNFADTALIPFIKGRRGLDFGSGPSPVLQAVLQRDYGLCVDIYDKLFAPQQVYQRKRYDFICCTEVIEHLSDPLPYFVLFNEHLNPGGVLSLMTLFHKQDDAAFLNWFYMRDLTHVSFYTKKTLETIAQKTGFILVHSDDRRCTTLEKARGLK